MYGANWKCVHVLRGTGDSLNELRAAAEARGSLMVEVDGRRISDKESLLREVDTAYAFPNYFGWNWNALHDCLSDLAWLPASGYLLVITAAAEFLRQAPDEFFTFLSVWASAADFWTGEGVPFHLFLVGPQLAEWTAELAARVDLNPDLSADRLFAPRQALWSAEYGTPRRALSPPDPAIAAYQALHPREFPMVRQVTVSEVDADSDLAFRTKLELRLGSSDGRDGRVLCLTFLGVKDLRLLAGPALRLSLSQLEIIPASAWQWEQVSYFVKAVEEETLSFYCAAFTAAIVPGDSSCLPVSDAPLEETGRANA